MMNRRSRSVYGAAARLFAWPLVLHPRALLGAADATGAASLYPWVLGWDLRTDRTAAEAPTQAIRDVVLRSSVRGRS
jgi:hypothetical protein